MFFRRSSWKADWNERDDGDVRERLVSRCGQTIVDRTGLDGSFDLELTFDPASTAPGVPGAPPGPASTDDTAPSIVPALQEQLGLKLESTRGPVDVLVIDSAERPTAN